MFSNSQIINYDDTCFKCAAYTSAFVQARLIQQECRINFSSIQPDLLKILDEKRAVNEIQFIDIDAKQVWYGMDALREILLNILLALQLGKKRGIDIWSR